MNDPLVDSIQMMGKKILPKKLRDKTKKSYDVFQGPVENPTDSFEDRYRLLDQLGKGQFGTVIRAEILKGDNAGEFVAVKILNEGQKAQSEVEKQINLELLRSPV